MDKRYQQIIDLQKKAIAIDPVYRKYDLYKGIVNKSMDEKRIIRLIYSMASRSGVIVDRKTVYYEMDQISPRVFYWNMKLDKPSEKSFISGTARHKIDNGYHRSYTKPDLKKYVFVDNGDDDYLISIKDEFSSIPSLISEFSIFKPQKKDEVDMKKGINLNIRNPTSTFWICFSIIVVGLLFCGTFYLVNKDNGRYEYQSGLVIDKKTGDAKPIKIKRD
jgi:hypothetical protein